MLPSPAVRPAPPRPGSDPTEAAAGPRLQRPRFHRLTAEQQLYLEQGIAERERSRGEPGRARDFEYELTLALSWFRNWWGDQTVRKAMRKRDLLTPTLPGLGPTDAIAHMEHDTASSSGSAAATASSQAARRA